MALSMSLTGTTTTNAAAEAVDMNAIVESVDVDGVVPPIDVDALLQRIDVNALLDEVDVNALLDRVDVDRLLDLADPDRLMDRVDVRAVVAPIGSGQAFVRVLTYPLSFIILGLGLLGTPFGARRLAWGDRPAALPAPLTTWIARRNVAAQE